MELKKILWPTDFSDAAAKVLPYIKSLTEKYDAEIHLLHVAEDLTNLRPYWGSGPDPKHIEELHEYAMKTSKERLNDLCKNQLEGCPRYRIHFALGDTAEEILKAIDTIRPDLVVMATRGLKEYFPFGSTAEKVIKNSPVPVLSINPST